MPWEHPEGILIENLKLRVKGNDQDMERAVRRVSSSAFTLCNQITWGIRARCSFRAGRIGMG